MSNLHIHAPPAIGFSVQMRSVGCRMGRTVTVERRQKGGSDYWTVDEIDLTRGNRAPNGKLYEHLQIAHGGGRTLRQAIDAARAAAPEEE